MVADVAAPLTEPIAVPDIFITGLARIENLGANVRLTFYAEQRPICGGKHDVERVVVARLVIAKDTACASAMAALATAGTDVSGEATH